MKKRTIQRKKARRFQSKFDYSKDHIYDQETYSLDYTIIKFTIPRLIKYKKLTNGYPYDLGSMEKWLEIIQKIIDGWTIFVNNNGTTLCLSDEDIKKIEEADQLFFKWFHHLWW